MPLTLAKRLLIATAARVARLAMDCSLRFARGLLAERGLRRGKPGDRHAERRARYIVETDLVAERDRRRIAAVLAADANLEVFAHPAAALDADPHQRADAIAIDRHERIARQDAARRVDAEERRGVVTADAEGGLGQVVGAEREELGGLRNLVGHQRR